MTVGRIVSCGSKSRPVLALLTYHPEMLISLGPLVLEGKAADPSF